MTFPLESAGRFPLQWVLPPRPDDAATVRQRWQMDFQDAGDVVSSYLIPAGPARAGRRPSVCGPVLGHY